MLPTFGQIGRTPISRQSRFFRGVNHGLQMYGVLNQQSHLVQKRRSAYFRPSVPVSSLPTLIYEVRYLSVLVVYSLTPTIERPKRTWGDDWAYRNSRRTRWER